MLTRCVDRFLDWLEKVVRPALITGIKPSPAAREDE